MMKLESKEARCKRLEKLEKKLKELEKMGLIKEKNQKWKITEKGKFYA